MLALAGASIVLLAGCGSSDGSSSGSRSTLNYVPTTSYALKEPATTTTSTTAPANTAPLEAGQIADGEQNYVVKGGDSLSKIASLYDVEMALICSYNGWPDCGAEHLLLVGDVVLIPPGQLVPSSAETPTATETVPTPDDGTTAEGVGCTHTIVEGDNPTRVAKKYNVTVDELANANLSNPVWNTFLLGASLNIPANGTC